MHVPTLVFLLTSLLPTALTSPSTSLPWFSCSEPNASINITNVQAKYDPNTRLLDIVGEGITSVPLGNVKFGTPGKKNATVKTNLAIVGFDYWENKDDICTAVQCPVAPGPFVFNKQITLINIPLMDWKPRLMFLDGTDFESTLGCIEIHTTLTSSILTYGITYGSVFTALSAGTTTMISRLLRYGYDPTIYDLSSGWAPTARLLPSRIGPGFMDVSLFAQFVAATGQLEYDYPVIYQDFVRMLAWATGTWNTKFISKIAETIRGGGVEVLDQQEDDMYNKTGIIDIKLKRRQAKVGPTDGVDPDGAVTGYDRYAAILGLNPKNLFLHTFIANVIVGLVVFAGCVGLAIYRAVFRARYKTGVDPLANDDDQNHHIRHYLGGWFVRVYLLFYFGLTSTSLHQLTISNEPPVVYALAGLSFGVLGILCPIAMILRLIAIARMNRTLDQKDPEIADRIYEKSIRGNITSQKNDSSVPLMASSQSVKSFSEESIATKEAAEVYARMRAASIRTSRTAEDDTGAERTRLRAFSVSSKRTSSSRSASWPLPPLYLSQKFMLLYGPVFNQYDPTHYIAHAEFLIILTWWLRIAPAFSVGILGKIVAPYFQFAVMISGEAVLFAYLLWKSPFVGKPANRWQLFLAFSRTGILFFVFVAFFARRVIGIEWIVQLISYLLILSTIGVHGLFLTSAGLKFVAAVMKRFKRKEAPPVPLATDAVPPLPTPASSVQGSLPRAPSLSRRAGTSKINSLQRSSTNASSKPLLNIFAEAKLVESPAVTPAIRKEGDDGYFENAEGSQRKNVENDRPSETKVDIVVEQKDAKMVIEDGNPYLDV